MFGYVRPPLGILAEEEQERFRRIYCGLCHTLGQRHGFAARFILNYDFTYLAILLSDGAPPAPCQCGRCPSSPLKKRCYQPSDGAMELAADESVILAYWQLRDGVADHGVWKGMKYRLLSALLRRAYRKAAALRPEFDAVTREQLCKLSALEQARCASLDEPADTFALLLAAAADGAAEESQRRVLRQMLYHLGRWVYLMDAADDLKKDWLSGAYNPVALRYGLSGGELDTESRKAFVATVDHSVHMIATAFELRDFGCWTPILESTVYTGLFQVGKAVLDGTFQTGFFGKKKDRLLRKPHE